MDLLNVSDPLYTNHITVQGEQKMRTNTLSVQATSVLMTAFLAALAFGSFLFIQPGSANAISSDCRAHGVVTDAVQGDGVTLVVTATGDCDSNTPLVLSHTKADGSTLELVSRDLTRTEDGLVGEITFVPAANTTYSVTIDGIFAADISK
jgi:hypothetical protein